jgi:2,5-diamino-6-(ribosylamino)-4(3H)-pyrimidinone 5'-phosphate reductase
MAEAKRYVPIGKGIARKGRPYIYLNVAMSVDGKLAPASRHFVPFSSRRDQELLMLLRTEADAVMAGARTVDLGKVDLGPGGERFKKLRAAKGLAEHNVRVIVSGSASLNPKAHIFTQRFSPIIVLTTSRARKQRVNALRKVADEVLVSGGAEIDFPEALNLLREKWNIRTLLCEGGGEINGGLFRANVVDRLFVTISPVIFGGANAPTLADGIGVTHVRDATQLELFSLKRHKHELFLVYDVRPRRNTPAATM